MSNSDDKKKIKITGAPQLSEMILGSLRPRVGSETTKWVAGLTDDQMAEAEQAAKAQDLDKLASSGTIPAKPTTVTTVLFMDYLFDCFQQYAFEFNRNVPSAELMVSLERPTMVTEAIKKGWKAPQTAQVFRGRISTQYWTLLLRGHPNEIEGWILPIEQLISFASSSDSFTQFLSLKGADRNGDMVWSVDDVQVTWDKIRAFAKQIFSTLVHVVKTSEPEGLVFTSKSKSAGNAKSGSGVVEPALYSFDEHNPAFDALSYEPSSGAQPKATMRSAAPNAVSAKVIPVKNRCPITEFIDTLPSAFAEELERQSAAGQAAFASQDMAAVEQTIKRTNKIKALRDEVKEQADGWKAKLKEALE